MALTTSDCVPSEDKVLPNVDGQPGEPVWPIIRDAVPYLPRRTPPPQAVVLRHLDQPRWQPPPFFPWLSQPRHDPPVRSSDSMARPWGPALGAWGNDLLLPHGQQLQPWGRDDRDDDGGGGDARDCGGGGAEDDGGGDARDDGGGADDDGCGDASEGTVVFVGGHRPLHAPRPASVVDSIIKLMGGCC